LNTAEGRSTSARIGQRELRRRRASRHFFACASVSFVGCGESYSQLRRSNKRQSEVYDLQTTSPSGGGFLARSLSGGPPGVAGGFNAKERAMNPQIVSNVIVDKAELAESVHEENSLANGLSPPSRPESPDSALGRPIRTLLLCRIVSLLLLLRGFPHIT
jgi:hypothetical protein